MALLQTKQPLNKQYSIHGHSVRLVHDDSQAVEDDWTSRIQRWAIDEMTHCSIMD